MLTALRAAARAALRAWNREREIARDIAELARMDNAQLHDLGITRSEIVPYVRGRLPGPRRAPARPRLRLVPGAGPGRALGA